jgi:hypothetical protein
MSGNRNARNSASITNRPTCGGNKKAGLPPRIGWFMQSNPTLIRAPHTIPKICVPNTTVQTQKYGYHATIGGV